GNGRGTVPRCASPPGGSPAGLPRRRAPAQPTIGGRFRRRARRRAAVRLLRRSCPWPPSPTGGGPRECIPSPQENRRVQHREVEDTSSGNIKPGKHLAMKPIVLTAEQRREIERRRKDTLDRRVYQRLTAVLAVAAGKAREEVAELLGVSLSQPGEWLRT